MPIKTAPKVLSWASDVETNTLEQAAMASRMPFVEGHIALMPDAHLGLGATVGSVIPTHGAIIPAAVGVDIGCGMAAVQTYWTADQLPDDLQPLHDRISKVVPAGVGQGHEDFKTAKAIHQIGEPKTRLNPKQANTVLRQMGTLGSGNHFVEVCLDGDDAVWVVLHSGSRGIGNQLARHHIEKAKGLMKQMFIELEDPDLAYFVQNTPEFDDYWADLQWAQMYALSNRKTMLENILKEFVTFMNGVWPGKKMEVNCHHNYTALENHMGRNLYITRKGAISAREGQAGIIPGSMGTNSFIVKGLGNPASYTSAPHGAGRRMSRNQAKKELSTESLEEIMAGKAWNQNSQGLLDEHPGSYKDVFQVMEDSADLVEVTHELTQILNYKGT
jgi:tRNA-splicing ligase RtcB